MTMSQKLAFDEKLPLLPTSYHFGRFFFWLKTTFDFLGAIIIVICTAIGGVHANSDVGGLGHGGGGEHRKGR